MIRKNRGEISWLEFHLLQGSAVDHAVLLRGGLEFERAPAWTSQSSSLSEEEIQFVYSKQVHGKDVAIVSGRGDPSVTADGLITKVKGIALGIRHADCQAAIFYDPTTHVIANVHAGWRGLVENIYRETILKLQAEFHVKPENLLVCIGPSLEPEYSEFINYRTEFPEHFWRFQTRASHFNLWEVARFQLKEEGINPQNIEIAGIGTYSNPDDFYSYRRSKDTLRNTTFACLI